MTRQFLPPNASFITLFSFGYLVTVTAGLSSYPIDTIRRRQMITNESSYQAAKSLISNHGWSSLFAGAMINIYRGMIGAFTLAAMDLVKGRYIDYKVVAEVKRKAREILRYRQRRNSILLNVQGIDKNRNDWNVIVNTVIVKYLDDYMQNEDIFKMKLTDAFAARRFQSSEIDDYMGIDMKFYPVVDPKK